MFETSGKLPNNGYIKAVIGKEVLLALWKEKFFACDPDLAENALDRQFSFRWKAIPLGTGVTRMLFMGWNTGIPEKDFIPISEICVNPVTYWTMG